MRRSSCFFSVLLLAISAAGPLIAQTPESQFFDSDGTQIRYVIAGQGDPVVLIHGVTASLESNWILPGVFGALSEDFMVIGIDARGHGKSGKPHDPAMYGTAMAEDIIRLLDHLKLQQAHIVGYSMGGFITLKLLTMEPKRFLSAVIAGAGWAQEGAEVVDTEVLAQALENGEGITPLLAALTPPGEDPPPKEQLDMINQMILASNDATALAAAVRGLAEMTVTEEELRANQVPTLAVIGSKDPLKATVDPMSGVMSELEIVVLEGADHMTAPSDPGLVSAIKAFLVSVCQCA